MFQQWQKVACAAARKERKVAKAVAEATMKAAVKAATTEEAMVDATVGAGETIAETVAATKADEAAADADWLEVLEVVKAVQLREQSGLESECRAGHDAMGRAG